MRGIPGTTRWRKAFARGRVVGLLCSGLLAGIENSAQTSPPVSFRNDVMAVLSKAGCNAGMCHGNQNGKAGFKLSLRGEDAVFDYNALTRDAFGRRTNPQEPERSLILLKATGQIAHEGGQRFKPDSIEYRILRDWITDGLANDISEAPKLSALEVTPSD